MIEAFEGWSSHPYWDAYGGVWTRGYGETEGIHQGSPSISRTQGEANLKRLVEQRYEWALRSLNVPLSQNQWDALCSFVWNLGAGIFQGTALGDHLRKKEWGAAANSMLQYDHAGGQRLAGLTRRRHMEVTLFLSQTVSAPLVPADEQRWENEWRHLKGVRTWAAHRRRVALKGAMTKRRKEIYYIATHQHNGWRVNNRYNRYMVLKAYTK